MRRMERMREQLQLLLGSASSRSSWRALGFSGCKSSITSRPMLPDDEGCIGSIVMHPNHRPACGYGNNYLRATRLQVGLLLHFGPEPAFYRLVNTQQTASAARSAGVIE